MKGGSKFYYNNRVGGKYEKIYLTKKQVAGFMNNFMNELRTDLETFVGNKQFIEKGNVNDMGAQPLDIEDLPDIQYFNFTSSAQVYHKVIKYTTKNKKTILGYRIIHEANNNKNVLTIEFIDNLYSSESSPSISSPGSRMSSLGSRMSSPGSRMSSPVSSSWQDAQDPYDMRPEEEEYFNELKNRSSSPKVSKKATKEQICKRINSLNETQMSMLEDCLNKMSVEVVGYKRSRK